MDFASFLWEFNGIAGDFMDFLMGISWDLLDFYENSMEFSGRIGDSSGSNQQKS
jgi:hypothetical protein